MTSSDLIEPAWQAIQQMQTGPFGEHMPYTIQTGGVLCLLANLKPEALAVLHGASYIDMADKLFNELVGAVKEDFDRA